MENIAWHDFPSSSFPIKILAYPEDSTEDNDLVWQREATGPGRVQIPGLHETGQRVRVVVQFADGTEERT